jgi:hypothetical protein
LPLRQLLIRYLSTLLRDQCMTLLALKVTEAKALAKTAFRPFLLRAEASSLCKE